MDMELQDEESDEDTVISDSQVLEAGTVEMFTKARSLEGSLQRCNEAMLVKKKEKVGTKWGPIQVERKRRRQEDGVPVLQRAIAVKQQKNLEKPMNKGWKMARIGEAVSGDWKDAEKMETTMQGGRRARVRCDDTEAGQNRFVPTHAGLEVELAGYPGVKIALRRRID